MVEREELNENCAARENDKRKLILNAFCAVL